MRVAGWMAGLSGAGALVFALSASAGEALAVREARVLATVPGQGVAAAYMTLESPLAARIVAAESDVAASVQIHAMSMDGGIMRMRRMDGLDLPAGRAVRLAPGAVHLMLVGLSKPLQPGDAVAIRFTVRERGGASRVVRVTAPVVARGRGAGGGHD